MQTDVEDKYTEIEKFFVLTEFEIMPELCQDRIVYTCTGVTVSFVTTDDFNYLCDGWVDGSPSEAPTFDGMLGLTALVSDFEDGILPPGDYTFTITGTAPVSGTTTTSIFVWTLLDPCEPPTFMFDPELMPMIMYTIL